ncbi:MAG: hypothetical protein ACQPRI_06595 [Solitalea-like symbiont of Tyrophagus putrescentiae]
MAGKEMSAELNQTMKMKNDALAGVIRDGYVIDPDGRVTKYVTFENPIFTREAQIKNAIATNSGNFQIYFFVV